MDGQSVMEELMANPGYCQIVRNISSFLDAKSLAQCRLVSQSWRDLIDHDRTWLVFQLEHIHTKEKTFVDRFPDGEPSVKSTIQERCPEWYKFIQQISRKQSIPRLKETVRQMWIYFGRIFVFNPLHNAIVRSNTEFVQLLFDCGIDLTMTDPYGMTPMHYACMYGSIEMVKLLIQHLSAFDATSRNDNGQTIFHRAGHNRYPQVLKLVLDTFKFEDTRDRFGRTMIHEAVKFGPKETIQFLLDSRQKIGFNLEAKTGKVGQTILHLACSYKDIEIVDLVVRALEETNIDIDFDTRNFQECTAVHCACMNETSDVAIKLLLSA